MAFAVALGGMIMNWSSDLGTGSSVDCSAAKVSLNEIQFCSDNNAVNIRVRNEGTDKIAGLALTIDSTETGQFRIELQDSALNLGESKTFKVPFLVAEDAKVSITASVAAEGEAQSCPSPTLSRQPLPKC